MVDYVGDDAGSVFNGTGGADSAHDRGRQDRLFGGVSDFEIVLSGVSRLQESDFIL